MGELIEMAVELITAIIESLTKKDKRK